MPSKRKPHNEDAGYIASRRSGLNRGWVVIYYAKEQGLDDTDGKYAVVCQTHNSIVNTTSLPKARFAMKSVDFCEKCMEAKAMKCRICGCTDEDCSQCIEKTGRPCSWVEPGLCSACKDEMED